MPKYFLDDLKEKGSKVTDICSGRLEEKRYLQKVILSCKVNNKEKKLEKIKYGYTSGHHPKVYKDGLYINILSDEVAIESNLVKGLKSGYYFMKSQKNKDDYQPYEGFRNVTFPDEIGDKKERVKLGIDSTSYIATKGKRYTYGIEIETCKGIIPKEIQEKFNWECVHDGSLRDEAGNDPEGGEYVTGVLRGDSGIRQLQGMCNELSKRTKTDRRCSVHVHLGSVKFTKELIVVIYMLACILEDEIFAMMPPSRANNEYCRKLDKVFIVKPFDASTVTGMEYKGKINLMYSKIFEYVSDGHKLGGEYNSRTNHPRGSKCGYRKSSQRYSWLNLVTCIFNTRGNEKDKTLEFRTHSGTTNFKKIYNWLLICMAFMYFIENHRDSIFRGYVMFGAKKSDITLEAILRKAYPKSYKPLSLYIEERKQLFNADTKERRKNENAEYNPPKEGDIREMNIKEIQNVS